MWEQIRANRRRSAMLISLMGVVLVLLGYCGGEAIFGGGGGFIGLIVAVVVLLVQLGIYFGGAQSLVLGGAGGTELSRDDCPRLFNIVEEMRLASGLPVTPKVLLIQDPSPNAFAFGRTPETYTIGVTSGLLHRLNRDELQGVIAHETGHLKNQDVQFMMLAAVMLGSIAVLAEITWRTMRLGGRARSRSDSRGDGQAQLILLVIALLLAILGPLLAQILYFSCSRKREFLADASAAQFTTLSRGPRVGAGEDFASRRASGVRQQSQCADVHRQSTGRHGGIQQRLLHASADRRTRPHPARHGGRGAG